MIPIPVLGKRWRVSDLFKRRQGAWFEPRSGYMWQENTGATATTTGGQTVGKLVDLTAARVASQATAANRPIYGVRRNVLTYSEDFSNAAWDKELVLYAGNNLLLEQPVNLYHSTYQTLTNFPQNESHRLSARVKKYSRRYIHIGYVYDAVKGAVAQFDLDSATVVYTNAVGAGFSVSSASIAPDTDGWYILSAVFTSGMPVTYPEIGMSQSVFTTDIPNSIINRYLGVVTEGVYVSWASLVLATNTDQSYQRVTTATDYDAGRFPAIRHADSTDVLVAAMPDLGGGVFSSAGSVYFATPQGMSCLHNQSIGTSYNLPAPNTDIYGVVITPARLAPPIEQRLALYMHGLAGLADADFFWQEQATDGMTGQLLADDNDTILLRA